MTVACLMGTYGRYTLACEALAAFLQQTALEDATLLIFNQHPIPLHFDHPRVTVVNEQMPGVGVRGIRVRMVELADPAADYMHWWDDDDLPLPWHLEDCLAHIGDAEAWKPERSWTVTGKGYTLGSNFFEGTAIFRAAGLRAAPSDAFPAYPDHPYFKQLLDRKEVKTTELGDLSSYLYRWNTGIPHVSWKMEETQEAFGVAIEQLRKKWVDVGPTEMVVPDLWPHWQAFLDGVEQQVSEAGHSELYARLAIADAQAKLGAGGGT